jgi:hypothetical protein
MIESNLEAVWNESEHAALTNFRCYDLLSASKLPSVKMSTTSKLRTPNVDITNCPNLTYPNPIPVGYRFTLGGT